MRVSYEFNSDNPRRRYIWFSLDRVYPLPYVRLYPKGSGRVLTNEEVGRRSFSRFNDSKFDVSRKGVSGDWVGSTSLELRLQPTVKRSWKLIGTQTKIARLGVKRCVWFSTENHRMSKVRITWVIKLLQKGWLIIKNVPRIMMVYLINDVNNNNNNIYRNFDVIK